MTSADDLRRFQLPVLGAGQRPGRCAPRRRRRYEIDWRAIQHDTAIPAAGEPVEGDTAAALAAEVATILELSEHDVRLHLVVPPVRSNTAVASRGFCGRGDDADGFAGGCSPPCGPRAATSVIPPNSTVSALSRVTTSIARRWQDEFEALPRPITPTLVLAGRIRLPRAGRARPPRRLDGGDPAILMNWPTGRGDREAS